MADTIDSAIDFLQKVRDEKQVVVRFIKKDGSLRTMICTLDFNKIPEDHRPKDVNLAKILKLMERSKILHVFDVEKQAWRSVPFDRVEWVQIKNKKYSIKRW